MRKGLLHIICLAMVCQTTILVAQQQLPDRPTQPQGQQTAGSNEFPPEVPPGQFTRRSSPQSNHAPRRLSPEELARLRAQARNSSLQDGRSVTLGDRTGSFRVSNTRNGENSGRMQQTGYLHDPGSAGSRQEGSSLAGLGNQSPPQQGHRGSQIVTNPYAQPRRELPRVNPIPTQIPPAAQGNTLTSFQQPESPDSTQRKVPSGEGGESSPVLEQQEPIGNQTSSRNQRAQAKGESNPMRLVPETTTSPGQQASQLAGQAFSAESLGNAALQDEAVQEAEAAEIVAGEIDTSETDSGETDSGEADVSERIASNFRTLDLTNNRPAQINTAGPKLRVTASGPPSVGIGKTARYEVIATNEDRATANDLIVGIDIPNWIEVTHVNSTQGTRELAEGDQPESRLIWNVKQIAAGTSEKLIIDVIPRQAKMFDLNIEWTVLPISATTSVQVTQPRLDISISGPNEVHYGDNVLYSVTVSNPGTGDAENVNVMLPEALGGERASLGIIPAGGKKQIQVELVARHAGTIELATTATGDGDLRQSDSRNVVVRRGQLDLEVKGPQMKYAGSVGTYEVTISNTGDAIANDVAAAVALPSGTEYLSGLEGVEQVQGGLRWKVGSLEPNTERTYHLNCQLNHAGQLTFEVATRAQGDLAATGAAHTRVEAVADLALQVNDPKGPLPTGQDVVYEIKIKNRGSKAASSVNLVMQFSEGIEPVSASGQQHEINNGQVVFTPLETIEPGQEIVLKVSATATQAGTHIFRAQLDCAQSEEREVSEGTTKFYLGNGGGSGIR